MNGNIMKRVIACILSLVILVCTCPSSALADNKEFDKLSDPSLLPFIEDTLYENLVSDLDSDEYYVQNVEAVYLSDEYIKREAYSSRENIYFGYKLSELDKQFNGQKYFFTINELNQTVAIPIEEYKNDDLNTIIKNVAIGTGVILVCVTVSAVSAGAGAPAVSMIFAVAAGNGTAAALSSAVLTGVISGAINGYKTGDMNAALKEAAIGASEGFKWGAIGGAITGGAHEGLALRHATLNGLTMAEAAIIQHESKLPLEFITNFHSYEEYEIYKSVGLSAERIGNAFAYSRVVDLDTVITDRYGKTMTNTERILLGNSPVDPGGTPYELHHIGQEATSPLAILTKAEHIQGGHYKILHFRMESEVDHNYLWAEQVDEFWSAYLESHGGKI